MEMPNFRPEQSGDQEVITHMRQRLLEQAAIVFHRAQIENEIPSEEIYIRREPLEVPHLEEVAGVMLTRDGVRPFIDEKKEHMLLYAPYIEEDMPNTSVADIVWLKDCGMRDDRMYDERRYELTLEGGLQSVSRATGDLREGEVSIGEDRTEASQLLRLQERLERFKLTPFKGEATD